MIYSLTIHKKPSSFRDRINYFFQKVIQVQFCPIFTIAQYTIAQLYPKQTYKTDVLTLSFQHSLQNLTIYLPSFPTQPPFSIKHFLKLKKNQKTRERGRKMKKELPTFSVQQFSTILCRPLRL